MRSFEIVEFKLFESDFFLDRLEATSKMIEAEFYLSAFLSATRSVTFALQASLGDHPPFKSWYATQQDELRGDEIAAWAVRARNASQKEGERFIGLSTGGADGPCHFFEQPLLDPNESIRTNVARLFMTPDAFDRPREDDIRVKCRWYMVMLVRVVHRCFLMFGPVIDPQQYYTVEHMQESGKTVEDFEEELGFPRGWTSGLPEENRVRALRREAPDTGIDEVFWKYLGMDRRGRPINEPYLG